MCIDARSLHDGAGYQLAGGGYLLRHPMQELTIRAASAESAAKLYSALSPFHPEIDVDEERRHFVRVALGRDREIIQILDTIQRFLGDRSGINESDWVSFALEGRDYTMRSA
jgi:hypothetical protein